MEGGGVEDGAAEGGGRVVVGDAPPHATADGSLTRSLTLSSCTVVEALNLHTYPNPYPNPNPNPNTNTNTNPNQNPNSNQQATAHEDGRCTGALTFASGEPASPARPLAVGAEAGREEPEEQPEGGAKVELELELELGGGVEVGPEHSEEAGLPWELADEPHAAQGVQGLEAAKGVGLEAAHETEAAAALQGVDVQVEELEGICCEPDPSNRQVRVPVVGRTLGFVRVRSAGPDHRVILL